MKKNKVVYKHGEFTRYDGTVSKYCIAAVSVNLESGYYLEDAEDFHIAGTVNKTLNFGFSVCRPGDEYNQQMAETIAFGKAMKNPAKQVYVSDPGLINDVTVAAFLEKESKYFEENPGTVLAGYNDARDKYEYKKECEEFVNKNFTEEEKKFYKKLDDYALEDLWKLDEIVKCETF